MAKNSQSVALERIEGWDLLEQSEIQIVLTNDAIAVETRQGELENKLRFGRALREIREVLEPKRGLWMAYLKHRFHMSIPTAYRYIDRADKVDRKLSLPIVKTAIRLGYDINPRAIENTRPPQTNDHDDIVRYLDRVTTIRPRSVSIERSTDDIVKGWLHCVELGWEKLPQHSRSRANALRSYIGMLMTRFGISNPTTFDPIAIPEEYRVYRGRPRIDRMKKADAA